MPFTPKTTLNQFREEMQHRVVKYPLNSRPVKEALRFAKKHRDAAFYRIASDKIHAQRQFQRELYGPGRLERLVDFFTLGSLREVVVTLLLVSVGVISLEGGKRWLSPPENELYEQMDIDELASALGVALDVSSISKSVTAEVSSEPSADAVSADGIAKDASRAHNDGVKFSQLAEEDVARIADAVMSRLVKEGHWIPADAKTVPTSESTSTNAEAEDSSVEETKSRENAADQQVAVAADNAP